MKISAGAGLTGGGDLSASRTLSLATVGTAGTYTKVTVDAYGRVTGHSSLAAGDIPSLNISKITGLQAALDSKLDASAFDELFEKVALAGGGWAIRAKYGLYSDDFISSKGSNPSAGGTVAGVTSLSELTDVSLNALASGQVLAWNGSKWVNRTLELGASSWDEIVGKPSVFPTNISQIGDLHSSWDALLKAAPSAYVTRWPTAAEVGALTQSTADGRYVRDNNASGTTDTNSALSNAVTHNYRWSNAPYNDISSLFDISYSNDWRTQLFVKHQASTDIRVRSRYNGTTWGSWRKIAFTDSNVASASKWATARTLTLTGDVTGSVSMDGSANVSLSANVSADVFKYRGDAGDIASSAPTQAELTSVKTPGSYYVGYPSASGKLLVFKSGGSAQYTQFYHTFNGSLIWRSSKDGDLSAYAWRTLLDSSNYSSTLDTRYVKKSGDTMTGWLRIKEGDGNAMYGIQVASGNNAIVSYVGTNSYIGMQQGTNYLRSGATDLIHRKNGTDYKIWDSSNDGSGSGLDADLLDGYHASGLYRIGEANQGGAAVTLNSFNTTNGSAYAWNKAGNASLLLNNNNNALAILLGGTVNDRSANIQVGHNSSSAYANITGNLYLNKLGGNVYIGNTLAATISSNVASATRLQTARTIWGQSFNGTANVSGALTGVTSIAASGGITANTITCSNWLRTTGQTGWYNETYGGGIYMTDSTYVRVSHSKRFYSASGMSSPYTGGAWISMGTRTNCIYADRNNSEGSAHCLYRVKAYNGNALCFGGLGNEIGFYMYTASDISSNTNAVLHRTRWNMTNGEISHTSSFHSVGGIYSDSYVSAKGQNTSSDLRLKDVLQDARPTLRQIAQAPAIRFAWKDGSGIDVGSSAQYWQRVLPDAVKERGGWLEMAYGNIALVSAISIAREVEGHEERIKRLERENRKLKRRVAELEQGRA